MGEDDDEVVADSERNGSGDGAIGLADASRRCWRCELLLFPVVRVGSLTALSTNRHPSGRQQRHPLFLAPVTLSDH